MRERRIGVGVSVLVVVAGLVLPLHGQVREPSVRAATPRAPVTRPIASLQDPVTPQGRAANGLFFNGPSTQRRGAAGIVALLRQSRLDTAVIDIKDDQARVLIPTRVPELQASREVLIPDPAGLVRDLHAQGIYVVGRMVCFNDRILAPARLDLAVRDNRPARANRPWISWGTGQPWLDPSNRENHRILKELAVEIASYGFDEIQLDYVRYPVDAGTRFAVFQSDSGEARHWTYVRDFVRLIDESIRIPIGVDIFGVSALREDDPSGLGQNPEEWAPYVEVWSPMLYANNYRSWVVPEGEERGAGYVRVATSNLRRRLGAGHVIRPFLQGFAAGAGGFDEEFVAAQIRAARGGGANGFLFWHPGSAFGMVTRAMTGPARHLVPFPAP